MIEVIKGTDFGTELRMNFNPPMADDMSELIRLWFVKMGEDFEVFPEDGYDEGLYMEELTALHNRILNHFAAIEALQHWQEFKTQVYQVLYAPDQVPDMLWAPFINSIRQRITQLYPPVRELFGHSIVFSDHVLNKSI